MAIEVVHDDLLGILLALGQGEGGRRHSHHHISDHLVNIWHGLLDPAEPPLAPDSIRVLQEADIPNTDIPHLMMPLWSSQESWEVFVCSGR